MRVIITAEPIINSFAERVCFNEANVNEVTAAPSEMRMKGVHSNHAVFPERS